MSNYLCVATITATLQDLMQQALQDALAGVTVRTGPPRVPGPAAGPEANLYLYMLSPNTSYRNNDLPTRNAEGGLLQRPSLAVDLHYVISFFGEQDLASERMLGMLASYLNAFPVLTPSLIQATLRPLGGFPYLATSDLAASPELVKLTPYYPTLEELSKLWTVFFQMTHRMSLHYTVGPVLIDAALVPLPPPPVVTRRAINTTDTSNNLPRTGTP
jgi:hypothetical protein